MKKLILKKEVVSSLNDDQLSRLKGGAGNTDDPTYSPDSDGCCTLGDTGCTWRASLMACNTNLTCPTPGPGDNWCTMPDTGCTWRAYPTEA